MPSRLDILAGEAANAVRDFLQIGGSPGFFIQFGSGFDPAPLFDGEPRTMETGRLPGMPVHMTPDEQHPLLLFGKAGGIPVLAARGHRHLYESCGVLPCVLPVCMAARLGIGNVILVDSGLSLNSELKPGKWLLLTDFMNAHHCSPLDGCQDMLPDPFPDMTCALSQHLNSELVNAMASVGISPMLGVYMSRPGSQFCTVAEAEAARRSGADMLGHDLAMEIIMAHALGCKVSAFALAALAAPDYYSTRPLRRRDMLDACAFCSYDLMRGLRIGIREFLR